MMVFIAALFMEASARTSPPPFDMTPYYAGTLQIEQLGETDRMLISPDGRYIMYGVKIAKAPGRWWFEKEMFCILPDPQPGVADQPFCMILMGRKAGDAWQQTFGTVTVKFTLLPARQTSSSPETNSALS